MYPPFLKSFCMILSPSTNSSLLAAFFLAKLTHFIMSREIERERELTSRMIRQFTNCRHVFTLKVNAKYAIRILRHAPYIGMNQLNVTMIANAIKRDSNATQRRKGRNESATFEILRRTETENEVNRYARVHDPPRRSSVVICALHGEIEIANNSAMEQYAPLTLICIKGVRIVSISNVVYTWLTV